MEWLSLPPAAIEFLDQVYFGNSLAQYGLFALILVVASVLSFVASWLTKRILTRVLKRLTKELREKLITTVRLPIRILVFVTSAELGSNILTAEPTEADPRAHWVHEGIFMAFGVAMRLALFWVLARVVALLWYDYLQPLIAKKIEGEEKRFFPVVYKLVATAIWVFAVVNCITVLGYDAVQLVFDILAAEAMQNSIGQYFAFLGLVLLSLLMARTVFNLLQRNLMRLAKQRAGKIKIEETWFKGFQRPVIYLITLVGFRASAAVLTGLELDGMGSLPYRIATTVIDVCLTVDITWIAFILVDKVYEHFIVPLFSGRDGLLDAALLPLTRKAAKVGVGSVGAIFMIRAFGENPATVLAGLGIGGVAIGFAAKDTLSPFISGIAIYLTRPYAIGDYIVVADGSIEGRVVDLGLRATTISTKMNTQLIVPNDKIINATIHNTMDDGRARDGLYLRIDIATTPDKRDDAIIVFKQAIEDTEHAHSPTVHFLEYGSDNLGLMLSYWIDDTTKFWDVRHAIMMYIDDHLREIRVQMSLPTRALALQGYLPGIEPQQVNVGGGGGTHKPAPPFPPSPI
jgi:MscS family membrane protein